jgi:hypothetical protein
MTTDTLEQKPAEETTEQKPVETEEKSVEKPAEQTEEQKAAAEAVKQTEGEHKENRVQRRIDRLTREKYELKARAEIAERLLAQQAQPTQQAQAPTREQFATEAQYIEALTDYKVREAVQKIPIPQQQVQPLNAEPEEKVREINPDYDEIMDDAADVRVPDAAAEAMVQSPLLNHLRYYMAKNPDKAADLFRMSPASAAREVGKIEARIEADIAEKRKPVTKKPTSAKPPIEPPERTGDSGKIDKSKLTDEAWFKMEQKKLVEGKG